METTFNSFISCSSSLHCIKHCKINKSNLDHTKKFALRLFLCYVLPMHFCALVRYHEKMNLDTVIMTNTSRKSASLQYPFNIHMLTGEGGGEKGGIHEPKGNKSFGKVPITRSHCTKFRNAKLWRLHTALFPIRKPIQPPAPQYSGRNLDEKNFGSIRTPDSRLLLTIRVGILCILVLWMVVLSLPGWVLPSLCLKPPNVRKTCGLCYGGV